MPTFALISITENHYRLKLIAELIKIIRIFSTFLIHPYFSHQFDSFQITDTFHAFGRFPYKSRNFSLEQVTHWFSSRITVRLLLTSIYLEPSYSRMYWKMEAGKYAGFVHIPTPRSQMILFLIFSPSHQALLQSIAYIALRIQTYVCKSSAQSSQLYASHLNISHFPENSHLLFSSIVRWNKYVTTQIK